MENKTARDKTSNLNKLFYGNVEYAKTFSDWMNIYLGGSFIKRFFLYPFYRNLERKLKSLGIDSDFKIYLSFFNFKNLPKKSVADFGYDPSSLIFFAKKKAGKIIILRNEKDSDNLKKGTIAS